MDKVILLTRKISPTAEIYISRPLLALNNQFSFEYKVFIAKKSQRGAFNDFKNICDGSILIISRSISSVWLRWIIKNKGVFKSIIYLFDDDFFSGQTDKFLPLHYRLTLGRISKREFDKYLDISNVIIVTSDHLMSKNDQYKPVLLNPTIHVPLSDLNHHHDDKVLITYCASFVHDKDFLIVADVIKDVLKKYKLSKLEVIGGKKLKRMLPETEQVSFKHNMKWPEFKDYLSCAQSHIALVPRRNTDFNHAKSHIKIFDIASMGAAGIFSHCMPYSEVVDHGQTGLLVSNDYDSWKNALERLIEDKALRMNMASQNQILAKEIGNPDIAVKFWEDILFSQV